jgi:hypothetical protein
MSGCHRDVATESPGGCDQDSGRRVGVAPLTRRRRASAWMHERPGQTENSGDYAGGGGLEVDADAAPVCGEDQRGDVGDGEGGRENRKG